MGLSFLAVIAIGLILAPRWTVIILTGMMTVWVLSVTAVRLFTLFFSGVERSFSDPLEWPFISVLVPLLHEANMVPQILRNLDALDYPPERLEIILITEESDPDTGVAVQVNLRAPFSHVEVPPGPIQTKPCALNYTLPRCRGDIVTVFDAEDHPHADQLRNAARAMNARPDWAAVQAPLGYYNADLNWLTAQFALEYNSLFRVWNPALSRWGLSYPLGGTSNHIRRTDLDRVGGWDAYNVTEDADLSFKFAALGQGLGYISGGTGEQATATVHMWHRQRVRWMKGFLQTWIVHMRTPFSPGGMQGLLKFLTLQLTVGTTLLAGFFHVPILLGLVGLAIFQVDLNWALVFWVMAIGYGVPMLSALLGAVRAGQTRLWPHIVAMPLYWLLMVFPAYAALWQYIRRPTYWNKTPHLTSNTEDIL